MPEFRKKPVTVEAVQFGLAEYADKNLPIRGEVPPWLTAALEDGTVAPEFKGEDYWYLRIQTLEGPIYAAPDDWIIRGVQGEIYPCKPDIFAATYEAASTEPTAAYIEIVEKNRTTNDTLGGSIIVPNEVRINGIPLLMPYGEKITVHEISFNQASGEDVSKVTLTLFARRVVIAAEGDL